MSKDTQSTTTDSIETSIGLDQFFEYALGQHTHADPDKAQAIAAIIREIENSDEYKKMSYSELEEFLSHIWRVLESYIRVQFGVDPLTDVLNEKAKNRDINAMLMVQSPETVTYDGEGKTE